MNVKFRFLLCYCECLLTVCVGCSYEQDHKVAVRVYCSVAFLFLGGAWHRLVGGYQYCGTTCQSHRQVSSSVRRILGAGGCTGDSVKCGWFSGNLKGGGGE